MSYEDHHIVYRSNVNPRPKKPRPRNLLLAFKVSNATGWKTVAQ